MTKKIKGKVMKEKLFSLARARIYARPIYQEKQKMPAPPTPPTPKSS